MRDIICWMTKLGPRALFGQLLPIKPKEEALAQTVG